MINILDVTATTTTTVGKEDSAKAEYKIVATGSAHELECFQYSISDYANIMCDQCANVMEEEDFNEQWPLFGGAYYDQNRVLTYIEKVIYNDEKSTVVVMWSDGDVTKAKCSTLDTYSRDTGLLLATMKKLMGNDFTSKLMEDWYTVNDGKEVLTVTLKDVRKMHRELDKSAK